jgi:hypothetical protein
VQTFCVVEVSVAVRGLSVEMAEIDDFDSILVSLRQCALKLAA